MSRHLEVSEPTVSEPLEEVGQYLIRGLPIGLSLILVIEAVILTVGGFRPPGGVALGVSSSLAFIAGLFVLWDWLTHSSISRQLYERVGMWGLVRSVGFSVFTLVITIAADMTSVLGLVSSVRWAASVGGGIGVLIGVLDARAIERAFEAGRAQRRQEETERERDRLEEFGSIVSHDVRSPLTVASGRVRLAREEHTSPQLETTEAALGRMDSIIADTLTFPDSAKPWASSNRSSCRPSPSGLGPPWRQNRPGFESTPATASPPIRAGSDTSSRTCFGTVSNTAGTMSRSPLAASRTGAGSSSRTTGREFR